VPCALPLDTLHWCHFVELQTIPNCRCTDFTYSQTASSGPISWPGRTHQGFSRLSAYIWTSSVQEAVDSLVLRQGSSIEHVVVAGHSMGAGVGTLLAYTIQVGSW